LRAFARESGVPYEEIRYAGLKDRHADTYQYVSAPREFALREQVAGIPADDLNLTLVGFSDDFVSTRVLIGNSFEVTLRSLCAAEEAEVKSGIEGVRQGGFPNYFDDQRFGSVPATGEFLAERIVKGHLKGALKTYLTAEFPAMSLKERERRRAVSEVWGDWAATLSLCDGSAERDIVGTLHKGGNTKNLLAAVNLIPREEMAMAFAAFQAAVWNDVLRDILVKSGEPTFKVSGKAGDYLFPVAARDSSWGGETAAGISSELRHLEIPTVARRILPSPTAVAAAIDAALAKRGITHSDLNIRGVYNAYLKSFYRRAVVVPQGLSVGEALPDPLYRGRKSMRLAFTLPKGSYATMFLKALLAPAGAE